MTREIATCLRVCSALVRPLAQGVSGSCKVQPIARSAQRNVQIPAQETAASGGQATEARAWGDSELEAALADMRDRHRNLLWRRANNAGRRTWRPKPLGAASAKRRA